jgi:hypothetical protein
MGMTEILMIFIAGMVAGAFLPTISGRFVQKRWDKEAELFGPERFDGSLPADEPTPPAKSAALLRPAAGVVAQQKEKKDANKQAILGAFAWVEGGKITREDVEKMLGVSEATALRYLDEMEREGKIRRETAEGRRIYFLAQQRNSLS